MTETDVTAQPDVVAITRELMDGSKIRAAVPGVRIVRPGAPLGEPGVVLVDLAASGALADALRTGARVIAYGSHVDEATLDEARAAGAEAMPRSRFFRRLQEGALSIKGA